MILGIVLAFRIIWAQSVSDGVWCRECLKNVNGSVSPQTVETVCNQNSCEEGKTTCEAQKKCEPNSVCATYFELTELNSIPESFMNGSIDKVRFNAQMYCKNIDEVREVFHSIDETGIPSTCIIDPGRYNTSIDGVSTNSFMCICNSNNCNGEPTFIQPLNILAKKYLAKPPVPYNFNKDVWILVIIVLGCGLVFITLALCIVTIVKNRRAQENDYESTVHPDDSSDRDDIDEGELRNESENDLKSNNDENRNSVILLEENKIDTPDEETELIDNETN